MHVLVEGLQVRLSDNLALIFRHRRPHAVRVVLHLLEDVRREVGCVFVNVLLDHVSEDGACHADTVQPTDEASAEDPQIGVGSRNGKRV